MKKAAIWPLFSCVLLLSGNGEFQDAEVAIVADVGAIKGPGIVTGIVTCDALVDGMRESIPSYRTQHIETNERALRAGWALLPEGSFPAWEPSRV